MIMLIVKILFLDFEPSRCRIDQSSYCGHFRTIRRRGFLRVGHGIHLRESRVKTFYWVWLQIGLCSVTDNPAILLQAAAYIHGFFSFIFLLELDWDLDFE